MPDGDAGAHLIDILTARAGASGEADLKVPGADAEGF